VYAIFILGADSFLLQSTTIGSIRSIRLQKDRSIIHLGLSKRKQDADFFTARLEAAGPLEIRLDATLCSTFVLARFLVYDMTLAPAQGNSNVGNCRHCHVDQHLYFLGCRGGNVDIGGLGDANL